MHVHHQNLALEGNRTSTSAGLRQSASFERPWCHPRPDARTLYQKRPPTLCSRLASDHSTHALAVPEQVYVPVDKARARCSKICPKCRAVNDLYGPGGRDVTARNRTNQTKAYSRPRCCANDTMFEIPPHITNRSGCRLCV
jgi:hypothetical protein